MERNTSIVALLAVILVISIDWYSGVVLPGVGVGVVVCPGPGVDVGPGAFVGVGAEPLYWYSLVMLDVVLCAPGPSNTPFTVKLTGSDPVYACMVSKSNVTVDGVLPGIDEIVQVIVLLTVSITGAAPP